MFRTIMTVLVALAAFGSASNAFAGAYGSAILKITNARLQVEQSPNNWVDATAANVSVIFAGANSQTSASLIPGGSAASGVVPGFDAGHSFVGSIANPGENSFTTLGDSATGSYARGDTWGNNGSLVGGVDVSSLAEVSALPPVGAISSGEVVGFGSFQVIAATTANFRLAFHADLAMNSSSDGDYFGSATSEYRVQVNGGELAFINETNSVLNRTVSAGGSASFTGTLFTAGTTLVGGNINAFTIVQRMGARAQVPEPGSIAIFGALAIAGLGYRRRVANV